MATTDERVAAQFDTAISNAHGALQTVQQSLVGAGPEAHAAMKALSDRAVMLQSVGSTARDYVTKLKADETLPAAYRQQMAAEVHHAADGRLRGERDALVKDMLPKLESALAEGTLPQASKDAGERMLRRQELDRLLAGATGELLAGKMADLIGKNPAWDSELLSDHGRAVLEAAGVGREWPNLRRIAAGKLMNSTVGTEKQLANRKALIAFYQTKLAGHVDGLYRIAKSKLGDTP